MTPRMKDGHLLAQDVSPF